MRFYVEKSVVVDDIYLSKSVGLGLNVVFYGVVGLDFYRS